MSKIVAMTTNIVEITRSDRKVRKRSYTVIAFDNGRVINRIGDEKWIEIRPADKYDKGKEVGRCRACGIMIHECDEWNFSELENWVEHAAEEDCKS